MKQITIPEPWLSFLREIDESANEPIEFHCLGGFAIAVLYGLERTTSDVDVISVTPRQTIPQLVEVAGKGSALHRKYGVYLDVVGVATVPENYEERLTQVCADEFQKIRLFALDAYDIALAKIERNIQRDRDDIKHLAKVTPFDIEILKSIYENELRIYLGNPEREDLTLKLWIEAIEETRAK